MCCKTTRVQSNNHCACMSTRPSKQANGTIPPPHTANRIANAIIPFYMSFIVMQCNARMDVPRRFAFGVCEYKLCFQVRKFRRLSMVKDTVVLLRVVASCSCSDCPTLVVVVVGGGASSLAIALVLVLVLVVPATRSSCGCSLRIWLHCS